MTVTLGDGISWELVEEACTAKQAEALRLMVVQGLGLRRAARVLGVSPQAVQARVDGAWRNLRRALDDGEEQG